MKIFLSAFLSLIICSFSNVFASSEMDNLEGKIYLDSRQIMIGNNGIFANLDGQVIQIESIFYDNEGLYFSIPDTIIPKYNSWICPNKVCLHPNLP